MKKTFTLKNLFVLIVMLLTLAGNAQTLLYQNTFNNGKGKDQIVGSGKIKYVTTPGFDSVYLNGYGGKRQNYFLVTDTVFGRLQASGSKELSIAFWVNRDTLTTGYFFTPLFSAYGDAPAQTGNTWPMFVLETRFWFQENCSGWCDFTNADNAKGTNFESTAWLDDSKWHYYTITITESSVKIYMDGIVQNTWNINGTDGHTVAGLFTNGRNLDYICLGGNQAWDWNDPDPAFMFDDLSIYASALTVEQINNNIANKLGTSIKENIAESVKVFPNPSKNYFEIAGIKDKAEIVITNIQGKLVSRVSNISSDQKIDISKLKPGTYFVKITDGKNVMVKKLVRQ